MTHAFECVEPCKRCKGSGSVGKGNRERECKDCLGSGACCHEWRGENPPTAPCRKPGCCICSRKPCRKEWCKQCFFTDGNGELVANGKKFAWPCSKGCCPKCGGLYVEWHSFGVSPDDVYLNCEFSRKDKPFPFGTCKVTRGTATP